MFESVVKLLEKVLEFLSKKQKVNREIFEKIYAPLMPEMEKVHEDYLNNIHHCKSLLTRPIKDNPIRLVCDYLKDKRTTLIALREKLKASSQFFHDDMSADERFLLRNMGDYFEHSDDFRPRYSKYTAYSSLVGEIESLMKEDLSAEDRLKILLNNKATALGYVKSLLASKRSDDKPLVSKFTGKERATACSMLLDDYLNALNNRMETFTHSFMRYQRKVIAES